MTIPHLFLYLQKSWTMSSVPPSGIITRRLARWNGEFWLLTTNPWEWFRHVPKCTSCLLKALQVRSKSIDITHLNIWCSMIFQLLKLLRNVANLYQLWKLFIWSRPRKVAWRDWWRIFNRKTEPNIELRMSTLLKVSHILDGILFFLKCHERRNLWKFFFSIVNVSIFSLLQLSNRSQLSGLRSYISILWFSVWFSVCPEPLFNQLSRSSAVKRINTMKEINMSFMPIERQVCRYFGMARRW